MSSLEYVKKVLADAERVVCLVGRGTTFQTGCQLYDGDFEYEIESRYGLSVEEIFSESYYNNRTREFFEFYREEVLKHCGEPNAVYQTLARMEQDGKLIGIISRSIFGLCERAGCRNVVDIHGTIFENSCPRCGRNYDYHYILDHKPIPYCENCRAVVRPQIVLTGEMVSNDKVTRATELVSRADVLLILGSTMQSYLTKSFIKYFNGSKVLLVNWAEHYSDVKADGVCIGNLPEILPKIYP